jgi:hypothetical protein
MPCVYFIRKSNRDVYKIGMSGSAAESRLKTLQTGSDEPLTISALIECKSAHAAMDVERYLHDAFAKHRLNGEWFNVTWIDIQSAVQYYAHKGYNIQYLDHEPTAPRFIAGSNGHVKERSEITLPRALARIKALEKANWELREGRLDWMRRQARAELYPEIRIAKAEIEARDKEIAHLKSELKRARARRSLRRWLRQVWGFFTLNPPKE